MKTIYVHINSCYGGVFDKMGREYPSPEKFFSELDMFQDIPSYSKPTLVKIELAEDETYGIEEYDGYESIEIRKKEPTTSKVMRCERPNAVGQLQEQLLAILP